MAAGVHPEKKHDQSDWEPGTEGARFADINMVVAMFILWIKGDWAEFSGTMGFPTWASKNFPCFLCYAVKATWLQFAGCSLLHLPWAEAGPDDYEEACRVCEKIRTIHNKALNLILC